MKEVLQTNGYLNWAFIKSDHFRPKAVKCIIILEMSQELKRLKELLWLNSLTAAGRNDQW